MKFTDETNNEHEFHVLDCLIPGANYITLNQNGTPVYLTKQTAQYNDIITKPLHSINSITQHLTDESCASWCLYPFIGTPLKLLPPSSLKQELTRMTGVVQALIELGSAGCSVSSLTELDVLENIKSEIYINNIGNIGRKAAALYPMPYLVGILFWERLFPRTFCSELFIFGEPFKISKHCVCLRSQLSPDAEVAIVNLFKRAIQVETEKYSLGSMLADLNHVLNLI